MSNEHERPAGGGRPRNLSRTLAATVLAISLASGCSGDDAPTADSAASATSGATATTGTKQGAEKATAPGKTGTATNAGDLFDNTKVHDVAISYNGAPYDAMIAEFRSSGAKGWIEATVTVDGTTFKKAGIRLKGNSSLMGLRNSGGGGRVGGPGGTASADAPNGLPWLVRLDKYVATQNFKGTSEFVIRSNNSQSSLNEAVALELLGLTGQVTQRAFSTRFSVNGGAAKLRLAIENPGDDWEDANFANDGLLYKAESGGDYSYRGDDAGAYKEAFDQESDKDHENYKPLIDFLKFINQSDDATFAARLGDHLDVASFSRYLAGQVLVNNFDDIDGPGNNSYLRYDAKTKKMTIVSWDLNLAFGAIGGAGAGGFGGRSNVLVTRFNTIAQFKALYDKALADMKADIYGSTKATAVLDRWKKLLIAQASDLVPAATIETEASNIARNFTA